jgi:hypothetical protein
LDEAAELLNPAEAEEFVLEIASTIRSYLMVRFELADLPESLPEFLEVVPDLEVKYRGVLERFTSLLEMAASIRFVLSVPDLEAIRDSARHVIIKTTINGRKGW